MRSQIAITEEVCSAIAHVREKARSLTQELGTITIVAATTAAILLTLTIDEILSGIAAIHLWEKYTNAIRSCHANIINIAIQWPCSHVSNLIAIKLIRRASLMCKTQWAIAGCRIESIVSTTLNIYSNKIRSRSEACMIHLTTEWIRTNTNDEKISFKLQQFSHITYKIPSDEHAKLEPPPLDGLHWPGLVEHFCSFALQNIPAPSSQCSNGTESHPLERKTQRASVWQSKQMMP